MSAVSRPKMRQRKAKADEAGAAATADGEAEGEDFDGEQDGKYARLTLMEEVLYCHGCLALPLSAPCCW